MIITIDGPAGSGKSSIAKELAKKLNIYYLNTGLLYRAVGYLLTKKFNFKITDFDKLTKKDLTFVFDIEYFYQNSEAKIVYKQTDITKELYNTGLDQLASLVSANKFVRLELLNLQRDIAKKNSIIADGRDCGSVVFTNADYKFYLTASLVVRAKRVFDDKKRKTDLTLENITKELEIRDERDKTRDIAPLIIPENAIIIDNSDLNEKETLDKFLSFIKI